MQPRHTPLALATTLALLAAPASAISVIGNLANFDAVNNTGHTAYGFEIELEDPDLWDDASSAGLHGSSKYVYSVFGLDRNFGGALGTNVTRFASVSVANYDNGLGGHAGVRITYGLGTGAVMEFGGGTRTLDNWCRQTSQFGCIGYVSGPDIGSIQYVFVELGLYLRQLFHDFFVARLLVDRQRHTAQTKIA